MFELSNIYGSYIKIRKHAVLVVATFFYAIYIRNYFIFLFLKEYVPAVGVEQHLL